MRRNLLFRLGTYCSFEEFSPNVLLNQILVTTLIRLVHTNGLDKSLSETIRSILSMFPGIDPMEIRSGLFDGRRLGRNNQFYGFILNVCRILYKNSLPSETAA